MRYSDQVFRASVRRSKQVHIADTGVPVVRVMDDVQEVSEDQVRFSASDMDLSPKPDLTANLEDLTRPLELREEFTRIPTTFKTISFSRPENKKSDVSEALVQQENMGRRRASKVEAEIPAFETVKFLSISAFPPFDAEPAVSIQEESDQGAPEMGAAPAEVEVLEIQQNHVTSRFAEAWDGAVIQKLEAQAAGVEPPSVGAAVTVEPTVPTGTQASPEPDRQAAPEPERLEQPAASPQAKPLSWYRRLLRSANKDAADDTTASASDSTRLFPERQSEPVRESTRPVGTFTQIEPEPGTDELLGGERPSSVLTNAATDELQPSSPLAAEEQELSASPLHAADGGPASIHDQTRQVEGPGSVAGAAGGVDTATDRSAASSSRPSMMPPIKLDAVPPSIGPQRTEKYRPGSAEVLLPPAKPSSFSKPLAHAPILDVPEGAVRYRPGLAKAMRYATPEEGPPARASEGLAAMRRSARTTKVDEGKEGKESSSGATPYTPPAQTVAPGMTRRWGMLSRFQRDAAQESGDSNPVAVSDIDSGNSKTNE